MANLPFQVTEFLDNQDDFCLLYKEIYQPIFEPISSIGIDWDTPNLIC